MARELVSSYRYEDCAVVALGDGSVLVGEQVAAYLHSVLTMLITEDIDVPGEGLSFGGVSQTGDFTYNSNFSEGEIEEYTLEYNGYLQEQRREAFQSINRLIGDGGIINRDLLRDRVIIAVSDGINDTTVLDVLESFLKPIRTKKLVIATPIAAESSVDKMHIMADELHILDVRENFIDVDHYYNDNDIPSHEETVKKINKIILNWR